MTRRAPSSNGEQHMTAITTHTAGPWFASPTRYNRDFRTCINVMSAGGLRFVAAVSCDPHTDTEQLAGNAHLIAAAPELLAALEDAARFMLSFGYGDMPAVRNARAAIAKAKGGAA